MSLAGALIWLVAGASLLGVVSRVAIPPLTWLALTFLLHASRSMPVAIGFPSLWLALYIALTLGEREIVPIPQDRSECRT